MRRARYITAAFIAGMLATGGVKAQSCVPVCGQDTIEVFLDSLPGIRGTSLNYNDFFAETYYTARISADESGHAERIRFKERTTIPSGNCDYISFGTAEKLLAESSMEVIRSRKWNPGKNICTIAWKPRRTANAGQLPHNQELQEFIGELITDRTRQMLKGTGCSTYIKVEHTADGTISKAMHIGNIFWETKEHSYSSEQIKGLSITVHSSGMYHNGEWYEGVYGEHSEEEQIFRHKDRILNRSARAIEKGLRGERFATLAGNEGCTVIEVDINDSETGVEQTDPEFPGGPKALKEFFAENIHYNKRLARNDVRGNIKVQLKIKKNGKPKLYDVVISPLRLKHNGKDPNPKILDAIIKEVRRATRKMPNWTPATYNGKAKERLCTLTVKIK